MATKLNTSANRRLIKKGKRVIDVIAPGIALVYRRGKATNAEELGACASAPMTGRRPTSWPLGLADDLTEPDDVKWLSYQQAIEFALHKARRCTATPRRHPPRRRVAREVLRRRRARGTGRPGDDETALAKYLGSLAHKKVAGLEHGSCSLRAPVTEKCLSRTSRRTQRDAARHPTELRRPKRPARTPAGNQAGGSRGGA